MCFNLFKKKEPEPIPQPTPEPEPLRDFKNLAELEAWFEMHKSIWLEPPNLCDDYSREYRLVAEMDGLNMECHLVHNGMVYGSQIFDQGIYHIGNMAIVEEDQSCWYVDPAWDKLVKLCNFYIGGKY